MIPFKRLSVLALVSFTAISCSSTIQTPPDGMIFFKGGEIIIGAENFQPNEAPAFRTTVAPFFIDKHPVTVAQFRKFTDETGYITEAEKFGNSGVLNTESGQWILADGANWKQPLGPEGPAAEPDHPVTHVSWNDAGAYAEWAGRRLPDEIEWEYAAKSGKNSGDIYSWGNEPVKNNAWQANVWQGNFPFTNTVADGYFYTSPVGIFGENEAGLTDMGGNVWEWTSSTYELYEGNNTLYPKNPDNKVIRGGSFLCDKEVCYSYRVSARQFNTRESATFHMGFRTAKDAE